MQIRSLPLSIAASLLVSLGLGFPAAHAQSRGLVELNDRNSTVRVSLDNLGVDAWLVDGVNQVYTLPPGFGGGPVGERYFLNMGSAFTSPEVRLDDFTLVSHQVSKTALSAFLRGFDNTLGFDYSMELKGGALNSGFSQRYETVTLRNLSNTAQQVTLFAYMDFDVAGTFGGDTLFIRENFLQQVDTTGVKATVTVDQAADFYQASVYQDLLAQFFNSSRTTLNNNPVLVNSDATAAFQFNRFLNPGEEVVFRFWKQIEKPGVVQDVPEPGSAIAFGSAALAGLLLKKFRVTRKDADLN